MKRVDICLFIIGVMVLALPIMLKGRIAIQPTGSYARGVYIKSEIVRELRYGDIVSVSFRDEDLAGRPDTYPLPQHLPWHSFIKIVYGMPGDLVAVSDDGFFINGQFAGPVFLKDSKGRPLSRVMDGAYMLQKGWYAVSSPHPRSYGSHYFGPVHHSQLKIAKPLWILPWDKHILQKKGRCMNRENEKFALEASLKNAGVYDLLFDKDLSEIMVNPDGKLWVDRIGKGREFTGELISPEKIEAVIRTAASYTGVVCHKASPLLEADLVDFGYARFQGVLCPITHAPAFSIRRKAILDFSLDQLAEEKNMLSKEQVKIIRKAVHDLQNVIISGGTNTGKTTFANAILKEFAETDRIVTLEDTMELETSLIKDVFPLRTMNGTVTMDDLLRTALRLRPDRILVGEVRGGEAWSLLKALSSGHSGGLCTVHAFGGKSTLSRLEQLVLEAGIRQVPRELIGEVIDVIIRIDFDDKTCARLVTDITTVHGYDGNNYVLEQIG